MRPLDRMPTASDLRSAIRRFEPLNGDWRPLDALVVELCREPLSEASIDALLDTLERFPTEGVAGALWAIVHALEGSPLYEARLLVSLRRRPADLSVLMVNRILNSGRRDLAGVPCIEVLAEVAERKDVEESIRDEARQFIARHAV
jgi:hypothetical protein